MDERLQVTDLPRTVPADVTAETPPLTMAWRALRSEHQLRVKEHRARETEARLVSDTLASLAEEAYRLRRVAERAAATPEDAAAQIRQLQSLSRSLIESLEHAGLRIIAPEGETYTTELMELLDNTAQRPDAETELPRVIEVITPAITYRGALLRMGQAVISVPAGEVEPVAQKETPELNGQNDFSG